MARCVLSACVEERGALDGFRGLAGGSFAGGVHTPDGLRSLRALCRYDGSDGDGFDAGDSGTYRRRVRVAAIHWESR
jgi:hypothetical protein